MKLPPWFRIGWWTVLLGGLSWLLFPRFSVIREGNGTVTDLVLTIIWLALALTPIFAEIKLFGFEFKAYADEIKKTVKEEVGEVRNELRAAIDVRNQFNPNIVFPLPSSDANLSQLREVLRAELDARLGTSPPTASEEVFSTDESARSLFAVRYNLEKELRRLGERHFEEASITLRTPSALSITRDLVSYRLIDADIGSAIREIYAVCSSAIHGKAPNDQQLAFVRDVAPRVLVALRNIDPQTGSPAMP